MSCAQLMGIYFNKNLFLNNFYKLLLAIVQKS